MIKRGLTVVSVASSAQSEHTFSSLHWLEGTVICREGEVIIALAATLLHALLALHDCDPMSIVEIVARTSFAE